MKISGSDVMSIYTSPNRWRTGDSINTTNLRKGHILQAARFYWDYIREFCLYTSQHGYKYIAQPKATIIERVFWTLVVLTAIVSAVFIMGIEWNFHLSKYTITSVDTAHYPLWNIPFPAVTVCGFNKVERSQAKDLIKELILPEGVTHDQAFSDMKYLLELLEPSEQKETKFLRLQSILDDNNITVEEVMKKMILRVAPQCEKLLIKCSWKGREVACIKLFRLHKTYEGYCCSFNYVGIRDEVLKAKMDQDQDIPRKAATSGYRMGLSVVVRSNTDEYYAMNLASFGVKVLVHDPYDYPDVNTVKKFVPLRSDLFFSIPPWVTYSTPEVRDIPIKNRGLRGCLFPDEVELRKMKSYSYNNCITECRENYTIQICGCTPFYYPNNGGYRICNLTDVPCLAKNKRSLEIMNPGQKDFQKNTHVIIEYPCNCFPDCINYYYPIESSEGIISTMTISNRDNFFSADFIEANDSVFNVFFSNFLVTRYRRDVLYSWKGLLGSLGGLLSLFIGFSLIGAVEIFYFFTFRLYYKIRARTARQHLSSSRNRIIQNIRRGEYSQFNITNPVQHVHFSHYRNFRNNNNNI
ncbi:sodium channel protein Nach-like [Periplaneta americana]|uniref:sodium channel protein Nach-like n=1 Tax=Periplaneta americana TaxID=6978 RepID=UPI0037E81D3B